MLSGIAGKSKAYIATEDGDNGSKRKKIRFSKAEIGRDDILLQWLLSGGAVPAGLMSVGLFFFFYLKGQPFRSPKRLFSAWFGTEKKIGFFGSLRSETPRLPNPPCEANDEPNKLRGSDIGPNRSVPEEKAEDRILRPNGNFGKQTTKKRDSSGSPFRAVMLSLAGTLGVGNIVGVANAIFIGGAGALFWMWVSAFLAMILKYAEIVLAVLHRRRRFDGSFFGGAVYYIKDHFAVRDRHRTGKIVSCLFAVLLLANAMSLGCMIQVNAVGSAVNGICNIPTWITGCVLLLLTFPAVLRGIKSVSAVTEILVPIMSGGYLLLSVAVLIVKKEQIGTAFAEIFSQAFSATGAWGGGIGFFTSEAVRVGTMRGLLSNEAGCGTSPTAHAGADTAFPARQGTFGILEVFADTILLCTLTGLVILVSYEDVVLLGADPVLMAIRAYTCVLGDWAGWFLAVAIACFGYATLLCWGGYGMESVHFLSERPSLRYGYAGIFSVCLMFGAICAPTAAWRFSDAVISAMTGMNLCFLVRMRREIRRETERYFQSRTV